MAVKKIRIRPEGTNDYGDVLHPETDDSMVLCGDGSKTLATKIAEMDQAHAAHLADLTSKTKFGHVKVGDRLSVVDGVVSADVQYVPVWGKATYTDSVSAGERLVKNINIGSGKKGGHIVYYTSDNNDYKGIVFFNTNYLKSVAISQASSSGARTSIREHEITGVSSFGNLRTKLDKIYISGNNLVLEILNDHTSAVTLNLVVYWEVW